LGGSTEIGVWTHGVFEILIEKQAEASPLDPFVDWENVSVGTRLGVNDVGQLTTFVAPYFWVAVEVVQPVSGWKTIVEIVKPSIVRLPDGASPIQQVIRRCPTVVSDIEWAYYRGYLGGLESPKGKVPESIQILRQDNIAEVFDAGFRDGFADKNL